MGVTMSLWEFQILEEQLEAALHEGEMDPRLVEFIQEKLGQANAIRRKYWASRTPEGIFTEQISPGLDLLREAKRRLATGFLAPQDST